MKVSLFLDSGAFSCWAQDDVITNSDYVEWVEQHGKTFDHIVSLDKIPGAKGKGTPTQTERKAAMQESLHNWKELAGTGVHDAICVYHYGEPLSHLHTMLNAGVQYLGLGAMVGLNSRTRASFIESVFNELCDSEGRPCVHVHGFGVSSPEVVSSYPWYSTDGTSYFQVAALGQVMVPVSLHGKYTYLRRPYLIDMGAPKQDKKQNQHGFWRDAGAKPRATRWFYDSLSTSFREYVDAYFRSRSYDVEQLRTEHLARKRANIEWYLSLEAAPHTWRQMHAGFFGSKQKRKGLRIAPAKFYFGMDSYDPRLTMYNEVGARNRLVSYYHIKDQDQSAWKKYQRTGALKEKPTKCKEPN